MQISFNNFNNYIKNVLSNIKVLIWMLALSYVLYSFFINNNLVNTYDGLWHGNSHIANEWEISLGRFLIPVLSILRLGAVIEPLISILALFYICLGLYLILIIFGIANKKGILLSLLTISSSTVCIWLSYRYASTAFALSLLTAVVASYILITFEETNLISYIFKLIISSVFIVFTLALYQTQLSITILIVMMYFILYVFNNQSESLITIFKPIIDLLIAVIVGIVVYKIMWDLILKVLKMNAASYGGANNLSFFQMIYNIPNKFVNSFAIFYSYFIGKSFKHDALNLYIVGFCFIIIFVMLVLFKFICQKKNLFNILLIIIDLMLIPSAMTITTFLAISTNGVAPQGTISFAILFTLIGILLINLYDFNRYKKICFIILAICSILLYGRLNQLMVDTFAMYDYRNASISLMNQIINRVDNLYNQNASSNINPINNIVFIGRPIKNELFKVTTHSFRRLNKYDRVNSFAKIGDFWGDYKKDFHCLQFSYEGLIYKFMNLNYVAEINKYLSYSYLYDDENFKSKKPFPSNESIFDLDGTIIVKVSD